MPYGCTDITRFYEDRETHRAVGTGEQIPLSHVVGFGISDAENNRGILLLKLPPGSLCT